VFVTGKDKCQTGNNPALCLHSIKAKDFFFHIFIFKETTQILDIIFF